MQNGVSSYVYEGEIQEKNVKRKERSKKEAKRKKRIKEKKGKITERFSSYKWELSLSF